MSKELRPITYNNERILTTEQLAEIYECVERNISDNFNNNKKHFEIGKHYYFLQGEDLKEFKNQYENFGVVNKKTSQLYLWTERGADRHCKMIGTDKAWEQFGNLEETYFRIKEYKQSFSKIPKLENLGTLNETAKILLKVFDEAGLKPQYKALALKQVYRKGGIELPVEELKSDKELYDLQTIAEKLGVYSTNNKPHRQVIGYIISRLNLEDSEKETVGFEANGHMGTTIQYTKSVIEKVKQWLSENNNPAEIKAEINGKSKKFLIKYKDVA